jgi:hypothetical protein
MFVHRHPECTEKPDFGLDGGVKTTVLQWLQQQAGEFFAEMCQCPLGHLFTHYKYLKMVKQLKYLGKETV